MDTVRTIWEQALGWAGWVGLTAAAVAAAALIVQLRYHAGLFGRIAGYRNRPGDGGKPLPAVSVVIAAHTPDFHWLKTILPQLLRQDHPQFEIVVVDVSGSEEFHGRLEAAATASDRLTITRMRKDPRFPINDKMAHNVGIKAAHNECIVLTATDCRPASEHWLSAVAKGFLSGSLTLGYARPEPTRTFASRMARADNAAVAMRWMAAAMRGKPYKGSARNLAFGRDLYFSRGGFNRLNLDIGQSDLFVQSLSASRTAVVAGPRSGVAYRLRGGTQAWTDMRLRDSYAFRFYPARVKRYIGGELWSRALFFASATIAACALPYPGAAAVAGAALVRYAVVWPVAYRTYRRLGERGLTALLPLTDLLGPPWECYLAVRRRLKTPPGIWR